jgi:hypothetical protein
MPAALRVSFLKGRGCSQNIHPKLSSTALKLREKPWSHRNHPVFLLAILGRSCWVAVALWGGLGQLGWRKGLPNKELILGRQT